jgi:hypothetical protein
LSEVADGIVGEAFTGVAGEACNRTTIGTHARSRSEK